MVEAENGIIGCLLYDDACISKAVNNLTPEMFDGDLSGTCYSKILELYNSGKAINAVTVSQMAESVKYSAEDIMKYLTDCVGEIVTSAMMPGYIDATVKSYKSRCVRKIFERMSLIPKDIDDSISAAIHELEQLQSKNEESTKSIARIIEDNKDKYFKPAKMENAIKTGFPILDDSLIMLEPGDITVIGARPSVGKSAYATQILKNIAKSGKKVCMFNLEMSESQVYERIFSSVSNSIELTRLRRAVNFLGGEEDEFNKVNEEISKYRIYVSTGSKSVSQIKSIAKEGKFDIVIIDYLQLIRSDRQYGNRVSEVGDISKGLKGMATDLHIHVIVLSQLRRFQQNDDNAEPNMSLLRESGDIEQDASNIVLMWNTSETADQFKSLKIEKNRHGTKRKIGMEFIGKHMTFREYDGPYDKFTYTVKQYENSLKSMPDEDTPFD